MEKPIRILHVLTRMDYGGTETLLMNLYRMIDRSKVQFDFAVSSTTQAPYDQEILALGGNIYHYPKYVIKNHADYCSWWEKFFSEHTECKIVHGHICSTAAMYLAIAKKHGCYTIAHSHNTNAKIDLKEFLYRCYVHPVRDLADYFFGCSKQAIVDRFGNKKRVCDNSCVLINGIDSKKYKYNHSQRVDMRKKLGIDPETFVVGHIGRHTRQKNPFFIIDVFEQICKQKQNSLLLYIGKGELKAQIVAYIEKKGLSGAVLLIDETDCVQDYLQAMDVFLFPSIWEGLGIVAIEAQASGLPVFASDAIQPEVNVTGLVQCLALSNSPSVWASRMLSCDLSNRRDTYQEILRSGFDIGNTAEWLQKFYLEKYKNKLDANKYQ